MDGTAWSMPCRIDSMGVSCVMLFGAFKSSLGTSVGLPRIVDSKIDSWNMKYAVAFGAISARLRHFEHLHHTQEIQKGQEALLYGCPLSLYLR